MSSPTSTAATTNRPPIVRTVYVLTDSRGWPIYRLAADGPRAKPDPTLAVTTGYSWLDQDVALARLKALLNLHPGWVLGLATVDLVLRSGGWVAASIGGLQ